MFTLKANKREKGNIGDLRKKGIIPAVFYGFNQKSTPVAVSTKEFEKVWKGAGESSTITLETDSGKLETLIHDVQVDPVKGTPTHVDFLVVDASKEIEVNLPIEFTGVSPAVKGGMGTLVKVLHELEVKALPKNMPHSIEVDISKLATLEDQILVSDITVPQGLTVVTKETEVVALVSALKEESEEPAAPVDLSAIEVEKKGKKEEEGAEAAETK